jgi:flagellar protein FlaG
MALEVLSGAVYHDPAKIVPKQRTEHSTQEQSAANINITEVPGSVTHVAGGSQAGKEQGNGKYDGQYNAQKDGMASEQQIKSAISQANNKMKTHRTRCEFSYHEETKRVSIKVVDKDTQEIIREIPPEETLEMVQKMWELAGILVDEKR